MQYVKIKELIFDLKKYGKKYIQECNVPYEQAVNVRNLKRRPGVGFAKRCGLGFHLDENYYLEEIS